jgi:hypothetical protein
MQKLGRFLVLVVAFVLTFMFFYCVIPAVVWALGGSFTDVSQSPPYAVFSVVGILPLTGYLFDYCFDENFYSKH